MILLHFKFKYEWARGATDNASDYGSEDCRFESCRARINSFLPVFILNLYVKVGGDIFIYILEVTCSISDHCHMLYYSGQR